MAFLRGAARSFLIHYGPSTWGRLPLQGSLHCRFATGGVLPSPEWLPCAWSDCL